MDHTALSQARAFLASVELPAPPATREPTAPAPRAAPRPGARTAGTATLRGDTGQALVVGGEIVAFTPAVPADQRADVANALLLAQLAATRQVATLDSLEAVRTWYAAYFATLGRIGFLIKSATFSQYAKSEDGFTAHEALLQVLPVLLGPNPAALAVATTALQSLKSMRPDDPWITLFERESRAVDTAHFQVAVIDIGKDGKPFVAFNAFGLRAASKITQVLFFRYRADEIEVEHRAGTATIRADVLAEVSQALAAKLVAHANAYIGELEI